MGEGSAADSLRTEHTQEVQGEAGEPGPAPPRPPGARAPRAHRSQIQPPLPGAGQALTAEAERGLRPRAPSPLRAPPQHRGLWPHIFPRSDSQRELRLGLDLSRRGVQSWHRSPPPLQAPVTPLATKPTRVTVGETGKPPARGRGKGPDTEARRDPGLTKCPPTFSGPRLSTLLPPTLASFPGRITALCGDELATSQHPHGSQPRRRMSLFSAVLAPAGPEVGGPPACTTCTEHGDPATERGSPDGRSGETDGDLHRPLETMRPPLRRGAGSEPQGAGRLAGAEGGERTLPPSCPPPPRLPVAGFRPEGGRRPGLPQSAFRTRSAALAEELLGTPAPSGEAGRGRDQAAAQGWSGGRPAAEQARGGYVPTRALSPATPPRQTTQASWLLTHLKF